MSWTDEGEPTINNGPTNYEGLELAFVRLRKEYEGNSELLRLNNRGLNRLEETMNDTLNKEQTTNKNYRSKTLKDIENEIERQRASLALYTQERIQATMGSQIKRLH